MTADGSDGTQGLGRIVAFNNLSNREYCPGLRDAAQGGMAAIWSVGWRSPRVRVGLLDHGATERSIM